MNRVRRTVPVLLAALFLAAPAGILAESYHSQLIEDIKASQFTHVAGRLTIHLAQEFGVEYFEVSAKEGLNIDEMFLEVGRDEQYGETLISGCAESVPDGGLRTDLFAERALGRVARRGDHLRADMRPDLGLVGLDDGVDDVP